MQSLTKSLLDSLTFSLKQTSTIGAIREYKGKQDLYRRQSPEVIERMRKEAIIESTESSNRLEGIVAPRKRIEDLENKASKPINRNEQELAGYQAALHLIHESGEFMPFSTNIALQLHRTINKYSPDVGGKWKPADNEIVEKNPDGTIKRVRFKAVSAVKTPWAMEQLIANYHRATEEEQRDPLLIIPLVVLDFLCIHPFRDGNGRTARLLTLLLLYHNGFIMGRYISLERLIEESKDQYYATLEQSSTGWHEGKHNVTPWVNYFLGIILAAYKEFENRVGTIKSERGTKSVVVRKNIMRRENAFAISDIERECPDVSRDMIRVVMRQLRDEGKIVSKSKGRGAKWLVKR